MFLVKTKVKTRSELIHIDQAILDSREKEPRKPKQKLVSSWRNTKRR